MTKNELIEMLQNIPGNPNVMVMCDSVIEGYTLDVNVELKPMFMEMGNDETILGFVNEINDDIIHAIIIG